jgi:hypothetical protein
MPGCNRWPCTPTLTRVAGSSLGSPAPTVPAGAGRIRRSPIVPPRGRTDGLRISHLTQALANRHPPPAGPSESAVQSAVVAWLVARGWSIERVADTASREHGVDILARRSRQRLAAEVKGYPSETYSTGELAGQPRKYHPASQARTYLGDALLSILVLRGTIPDALLILALPDVGSYPGLVDKVEESLTHLGVWVLLVARDGSIAVRAAGKP